MSEQYSSYAAGLLYAAKGEGARHTTHTRRHCTRRIIAHQGILTNKERCDASPPARSGVEDFSPLAAGTRV